MLTRLVLLRIYREAESTPRLHLATYSESGGSRKDPRDQNYGKEIEKQKETIELSMSFLLDTIK